MSKSSERRSLALGGDETLSYSLERTGRRRTVGIFVEPSGQLTVMAPTALGHDRIEQVLRRRLRWIRRQQREVAVLPPRGLPREWVSGETHRYLGRQYRLKVIASEESSVKLRGGYFVVSTTNVRDTSVVECQMEAWYAAHAEPLLRQRVDHLLGCTTWIPTAPRSIRIRRLERRWASTTSAGTISFNLDLIKLPLCCIDYVVAHELVHLGIPNHSPAFWRQLDRVMPDWRRWRARLEQQEC